MNEETRHEVEADERIDSFECEAAFHRAYAPADKDGYRMVDPPPCRMCGTPTSRVEHCWTDGDMESGPYSWDVPRCQSCADWIEAGPPDPPCQYCGADGETMNPCCPEAEAEAMHYAVMDEAHERGWMS